jgi:1,4-alpha-glucan branching enzyme
MNAYDDHQLTVDPFEAERLALGEHHDPHAILGAHPLEGGGVVVRAFHPDAEGCVVVRDGQPDLELHPVGHGIFAGRVEGAGLPLRYRLRFYFSNGSTWERPDPYAFLPTVGEMDLYLLGEGTHRRLYEALGARLITQDGVRGVAFAVWAPNARRVSLIGEFNGWDGRLMPMRCLGRSGVWEIFVPGLERFTLYKFEVKSGGGELRVKTDPLARKMELPPSTASVVDDAPFTWSDQRWMDARAERDHTRSPISIYELHLGSWARVVEEGNRSLSYREIAPRLVEHCHKLGYTHVEFLPLAEHAFYPSWGYQVTGYYAPTARYGDPIDLKYMVNYLHEHGIGVIMDWVPAHFPKDDFALRRFDGTALYEHDDHRRGEHPDWGTLIFNYGRAEVRAFLIANAIYWLREFHIDGLRVDAVASMLYLDYSREDGQWVPNVYGGRENLEAIDFLRQFNIAVREEAPGALTIAEESTAWGGVSRAPEEGGLGFTFKWNMGWMHDTLGYFQKEPIHRKYHQDQLTFAMLYEYTERFINSISHDEVVHGKGALIEKMPGDFWQKLANLRVLFAYQATRPGKQLTFMGGEIGQHAEWDVDGSLDWHLTEHPQRKALLHFVSRLGEVYKQTEELWRADPDPESFCWIDCADRDNSVLSYQRRIPGTGRHVVMVMNLTPVPRDDYRIGMPEAGRYRVLLNTDATEFGGSGYLPAQEVHTEYHGAHGHPQSVSLCLPPLSLLVLRPE